MAHPAATPPPAAGQADRVDLTGLPEATTFGDLDGAVPDPDPRGGTDGVVLRIDQDVGVHDAPGGTAFARLPAAQLGNPTWVPVLARRGEWAQVLLPSRPNSGTGWIRVRPTDPVSQARTPYRIDVDVDARRLVVWQGEQEIGSWTVGVGKEQSPTPRGRTYLMAAIEETVTEFSPIILPLGTHSETFNSYGGGPGTVALHGWPTADVFGKAASDGCVRVPPDALQLLSTLPLGTIVSLH
ncbi:L,D-transpeptidase [Saccharopolyspora sp. MS10]|uniref:L,D-transpeptidase n=1 Tax=Saccharopolyspora sp. MS10 TaxID=3385973 RepID=UPI0039A35D79